MIRARGLIGLLALLACERRPLPAVADAGTADATVMTALDASADAAPVASVAAGPPDAFGVVMEPGAADACGLEPQKIKSAKSVGHTSVVYKVELEGGRKFAWKPNAKKVKERWRGELAAYKLGQALGLPNVPPVCKRHYPVSNLVAALGRPALDELVMTPGAPEDFVEGVLIPWIPGLQFLPLEKEPLRTDVRSWLRDRAKPVPADKVDLAAQLSSLVVFDAITSNWDRYSGANVGLDASGKLVLFIDNDAAFMTGPPPERLRENEDAVLRTERFSRALVAALRSYTDEGRLGDVFGLGFEGLPLLPVAVTKAVAQRVTKVLAIIDAKVAARTEADVLVFP